MAENKDVEIMRQFIAKKKEKSASQGSIKRGPQDLYGTSKAHKNKDKKGDLVSGENAEPGDNA